MKEHHELMGGKLHVYRRENSGNWQCSTYLAGKNWRVSTKEDSLARAKDFAEDWYLGLKGKSRAGELKVGKTFKQAADQFLREYEIITAGERSAEYVESVGMQTPGSFASVLRRQGVVRNHAGPGSGISHPSRDIAQG